MNIAKDISEYSISECISTFEKTDGIIRLKNIEVRLPNSYCYNSNVYIDGEKMEIYVDANNRYEHIKFPEMYKDFTEFGFDVVCDIDYLWIIFEDFITIVCSRVFGSADRSYDEQEKYASICKFIRGANYKAGIITKTEREMGFSTLRDPQEIIDFDGVDVKNWVFNKGLDTRTIKVKASRILRRESIDIDHDDVVTLGVWDYITHKLDACHVTLSVQNKNLRFSQPKYWVDYEKPNRILIGDWNRKQSGVLLILDEDNDKINYIKNFLYACTHYDLYVKDIIIDKEHKHVIDPDKNKEMKEKKAGRKKRTEKDKQPGRIKCEQLRTIRKKIAKENNIPFEPAECNHTGFCLGTCPVCDAEIQYLDELCRLKKERGEKINIVGISEEEVRESGCHPNGKEERYHISMGMALPSRRS